MNVNGDALATIRQLNGLSQAELSRKASVSQGFISELESGTKTKAGAPTVKKLADALSVPMTALAVVSIRAAS